ncbi:MAG: rubredoxin [Microcystaceae cyanobacterium]
MSDRPPEKTLAEQASPNYECRACGYIYVPSKGDGKGNIPSGTPFQALPEDWRCPVCGVPRRQFTNTGSSDAPSGFAENLNYGFGVNRLSPDKKNLLIFGALLLGFIFFISLYGLN